MATSKPIGFLVRHGETVARDRGIFISWIDYPLDEEGKEQAQEAVDFLSDYEIENVYSSPLQRCVYAAKLLGKPFQQDRGLLPWNRGILTGISEEDGKSALKLFSSNPSVAIPYGESRIDCEKRLSEFFIPALERAESSTTAFFCHHSVIDVLNCLLKGERTQEPQNLVKTGGIVGIYVDGDGYRLEAMFREDDSEQGMS